MLLSRCHTPPGTAHPAAQYCHEPTAAGTLEYLPGKGREEEEEEEEKEEEGGGRVGGSGGG